MRETTNAFVTSLVGVRDWNRQNAQIRDWASAGRTDLLRGIAETVSGPRCPEGVSPLVRKAMLESILRCLALTRSEVTAEAALCCSPIADRLAPPYDLRHLREHLASLLACGQTDETLEPLFERHGKDPRHRELLACLVHETTLRSGKVPGTAADFYEQHVVGTGHPLGRLPLRLLPQERMLAQYLPHYGPQSTSWPTAAMGDGPATQLRPEPGPATAARWTPVALSEDERTSISAAVQNWEEESNGVIEVGVFRAGSNASAGNLSVPTLLSLPMECLHAASARDVTARTVPRAEALSHLFAAASTGGAYNSGLYGAYGRLAAWRSVAGLLGAAEGTPLDEVAAAGEHCVWMAFEANTGWFRRVAWDLGLTVLRPDGRTLAVLAATDTD